MRVRFFVVFAVLLAAALAGLGVPLAVSDAREQARVVYIDRLADLARFAELLPDNPGDVDKRAVLAELRRYEDLYGIPVAVVGTDRTVMITSRPGVPGDDPVTEAVIRAALVGRAGEPPQLLLPGAPAALVVAQPVMSGGDVVGAVVSVSDTTAARGRVLRAWVRLAVAAAAVFAAGLLLAHRLARWVIRPVAVLDDAAHRLADGDLAARVPETSGPPELRRLARSFNVMAVNVRTSLEAQRAFVADAGHQLRNPLGALLLRLQGLQFAVPPDHSAAVERAVDDGRYLAETLDRMLELARAEHVEAELADLDAAAILDSRLESWSAVAERRSVRIVRTGVASAFVRHDRAAIAGSVDAVLDNALKYGPEGGTITVEVRPGEESGSVEIAVTDEGPGVDGDDVARLGDRFWRSPRQSTVPGSGLGLSIATTLLQRHGGGLHVHPGVERGLVVVIRLPAAPDHGLPAR